MKQEFIEKQKITYGCGCVHEIGLGFGGGFWKPTEVIPNCEH